MEAFGDAIVFAEAPQRGDGGISALESSRKRVDLFEAACLERFDEFP